MTRGNGQRLRAWLPGLVAALTALGTVVGLRLITATPSDTGNVLMLASAQQPDGLAAETVALHSSTGWLQLANAAATSVPAAPQTATLVQAQVPVGTYDALRLGSDSVVARITVGPGLLEPVLVPVAHGRPLPEPAYTGNDSVNLGLQELSGELAHVTAFHLVDQNGRSFSNAQLSSHVTLVASFHTSCGESCPLYTGLLLQLQRRLPPSVSIAEVTTDPWQDSPPALLHYARRAGARWTFLTGSPADLALFWAPLGVQLSRTDTHVSTLAVVDSRGYIVHSFDGVPDLDHRLPSQLRSLLDAQGIAQLASGGDGWGAAQVLDAISTLNLPPATSRPGGGRAADWALPGLNGGQVTSEGLAGRALVINFWAAWCTPCRTEMPMLQAQVRAHPGVALLFIDERDDAAAARDFVKSVHISEPVALDAAGMVGDQFGVVGLPVTVFVRADGTVEGTYLGALTIASLANHLADLQPG